MRISAEPEHGRVIVELENDAEEATFAYDLIHSGRLQGVLGDRLPLPFRGEFLLKVPLGERPVGLQVGRFEATSADVLAGKAPLKLVLACPHQPPEIVRSVEETLRTLPQPSAEELVAATSSGQDEHARIRRMTFAQRVIYATRAGSGGRAALLQQPTALLLLYVCKNPLITLPELIQIAKMPSIDALVADYLARLIRTNPRLAASEEFKIALCTNSKTPAGTALSLLAHLSSRGLRKVAKCEVSGSVKNGAIRLLLERRD
jgi:hypothetical protein